MAGENNGVHLRVLLVDASGAVRGSLRDLFDQEADADVAAETDDAADALRLAKSLNLDLALVSSDLPGVGTSEMIRELNRVAPRTKVLSISNHNDSRTALRAVEAGAAGYLLKEHAFDELSGALRALRAGRTYISPGIAGVASAIGGQRPLRMRGGTQARILALDDDAAILELIRRVLTAEGHHVVTASSAARAIEELELQPPDLALVDLSLPVSNGVEVIRAIREVDAHLPVIVLTGYPDGDLMNAALAYSPLTVLAKPVRLDALRTAVRGALRSREMVPGTRQESGI